MLIPTVSPMIPMPASKKKYHQNDIYAFWSCQVDRKFEAFSILLYRKECWEYVFLRMRWANQDNTKIHDFFKANTKDFQPNNHLAIFKNSQSCTSLNKHIILEQKTQVSYSFHVFFSLVYSPPLGVVKKVVFRIVKVLNFGSARTFSPKRQLLWRILGMSTKWVPWWDKACRYDVCVVFVVSSNYNKSLVKKSHVYYIYISYGVVSFPQDPCMEYLPTFTIKINHSFIRKYTSPMDPMGVGRLSLEFFETCFSCELTSIGTKRLAKGVALFIPHGRQGRNPIDSKLPGGRGYVKNTQEGRSLVPHVFCQPPLLDKYLKTTHHQEGSHNHKQQVSSSIEIGYTLQVQRFSKTRLLVKDQVCTTGPFSYDWNSAIFRQV